MLLPLLLSRFRLPGLDVSKFQWISSRSEKNRLVMRFKPKIKPLPPTLVDLQPPWRKLWRVPRRSIFSTCTVLIRSELETRRPCERASVNILANALSQTWGESMLTVRLQWVPTRRRWPCSGNISEHQRTNGVRRYRSLTDTR